MSVPKYDDMMLPMLICLSEKPDGEAATAQELRDFAADYWGLTEDQKAETIPSGFARYMNNVQWACTYLKQLGASCRPRARRFRLRRAVGIYSHLA